MLELIMSFTKKVNQLIVALVEFDYEEALEEMNKK